MKKQFYGFITQQDFENAYSREQIEKRIIAKRTKRIDLIDDGTVYPQYSSYYLEMIELETNDSIFAYCTDKVHRGYALLK